MYIYLIKNETNSYFKIGVSKNPLRRLKELQTGSSDVLTIFNMIYVDKNARIIEKFLHNINKHNQINNEWFDLDNNMINNFNSIVENHNKQLNELSNN